MLSACSVFCACQCPSLSSKRVPRDVGRMWVCTCNLCIVVYVFVCILLAEQTPCFWRYQPFPPVVGSSAVLRRVYRDGCIHTDPSTVPTPHLHPPQKLLPDPTHNTHVHTDASG